MTRQGAAEGPILDDVVVRRLGDLRRQVQRPEEDLLGELILLFERDSAARLQVLRAPPSPEERRQAAHALKGSAANLGALRVAARALHIERNPEDPVDVDGLAAAVAEAIVELRRTLLAPG